MFSQLSELEKNILAGIVSASTSMPTQKTYEHSLAEVEADEVLASELALVGFVADSFAGFIRAKPDIVRTQDHRVLRQIGSLIVMPGFRNMGVGNRLTSDMTQAVQNKDIIPYAYCGPESKKIFHRVGYVEAAPNQFPLETVSPLGNRLMYYPD